MWGSVVLDHDVVFVGNTGNAVRYNNTTPTSNFYWISTIAG